MQLRSEAIILAVRPHGENGAIVHAFTPGEGVQHGYVRGGKSRQLRPVLQPGNAVIAEFRARTDSQLAQLTVELAHSRADLAAEPLTAAALDWLAALSTATLPEAQPYPRLYAALDGLLRAMGSAAAARSWMTALVRYELLLLAELGFGLDLEECAVTAARDGLAFVSPKSGRAVSIAGAMGHESKLLKLPSFLSDGGAAAWPDIGAGLALTRHFIARDLLIDRRADILAARDRLSERIRRIVD